MMETKSSEQIKLEVQEWYITNTVIGILGLLAPAACFAFLVGHTGVLIDFILNIDYSKPKAPPSLFHRWLTTLLFWPLRSLSPRSNISRSSISRSYDDSRNPVQVWKDGSLLCTLINMTVPGACKDPREHRLKPPKHGVQLVMEYLDIQPIFTHDDFNQKHLTLHQEKRFSKYLHEVHKSISKQIEKINNMRFSTDYVARGMGLVIGEQYRKSVFYIYPIPKQNHQPCDLEVSIKGPCGHNGHIVIPSILHYQQKWQPPTEYKRAMYMSSKLNSISPTIQGTSFLRRLSLYSMTKIDDSSLDIDIRVKISPTRAKVTYIPIKTGIYEITLITKDCHVVGSPYSVPTELPSSSSYLSNDSSNESDENEGKYIKRKKKVISRIVDFIDEKMLLQSDGTLVKIDQSSPKIENKNDILNITNPVTENNPKITGELIEIKNDPNQNTVSKIGVTEDVPNEEHILLENKYLQTEKYKNNEITISSNIQNLCTTQTPFYIDQTEETKKDHIFNEDLKVNETKLTIKKNEEIPFQSNFEANIINLETSNEEEPKEIRNKHNFEASTNKFIKDLPRVQKNLIINKLLLEQDNVTYEQTSDSKNVEILSTTENAQINEIEDNIFEDTLQLNQTLAEDELSSYENEFSKLNITHELEENNNIIFNVSKLLSNDNEQIYVSEKHINIENLDDTTKDKLFFTPDILETFNKNTEKSLSFIDNINDEQISNTSKSCLVGPTLLSKVENPALDFSTSEYRKTFSKKDPSKDLNFSFNNSISSIRNQNGVVNNLVKMFDVSSQETEILHNNEESIISSLNDPDLVKCHSLSNLVSSKENIFHKKVKPTGTISKDYDEHQCYLKEFAQPNFEQYVQENTQQEDNKLGNVKPGIVDKQKQFWNQKYSHQKVSFDSKAPKQKIIFKDYFITKNKNESKKGFSNLQNCKPFEGLVENNIKIFENRLTSSSTSNINPDKYKLEIQKSKSESCLQQADEPKMYQIQKTISNEEIIIIPSIEERRKKLLQACQQSYSLADISVKKLDITSDKQATDITRNKNVQTNINQDSDGTPQQKIQDSVKKEKKLSFKRKSRFKRAKLFFHNLEGSDPKINIEQPPYEISKPNISRSESDSCVSYHKATEAPTKSLRISDRFQVDDLFQDILGDDKRFIGIPNKMAVVASLASLDSDSSRAEYDSGNEAGPDWDYFTGKPKKTKRRKNIPGFHDEYPHPPTTETWRYKSRSNTETGELIPGRILLTKSETHLDIT